MRAIWTDDIVFRELILLICGEEYESWSFSLRYFEHPDISSFLSPNIFRRQPYLVHIQSVFSLACDRPSFVSIEERHQCRWCRQPMPLKRRQISTRLQGVTSHKNNFPCSYRGKFSFNKCYRVFFQGERIWWEVLFWYQLLLMSSFSLIWYETPKDIFYKT
jgi:hypothetical protein